MTRKYETTAIRQVQILDAVRKLITTAGSEHVTVRRIAKEVGITEAAIYRHFKSKRDILLFLVDDIEESLVGAITSAIPAYREKSVSLDGIMADHVSEIARRQGASFQVIAEIISFGDKKLNQKVAGVINKYIGALSDLLRVGRENGEVKKDIDLNASATLLFSMVQGLVNIWALVGYDFDLEERYRSVWPLIRQATLNPA